MTFSSYGIAVVIDCDCKNSAANNYQNDNDNNDHIEPTDR